MIPGAPTLLHELLRASCRRHPDKTALVKDGARLSYGELDRLSDSFAAWLRGRGFAKGDRAVIFLDGSFEAVASLYGAMKAGGAFVLAGGGLKAGKLSHILRDSGATFLVASLSKGEVASAAAANAPSLKGVVWAGEGGEPGFPVPVPSFPWNEVAGRPDGGPLLAGVRPIDLDLAALIYTSGTTGEPKGIVCPHRNMVAAARSIVSYLRNRPDEVILDALPLSFDYGLYQVLMSCAFGGTVVLESFDFPTKVLQTMEREKVTGLPVVPIMLALLLRQENLSRFDLGSLRYLTNTGAALPGWVIRRFRSLYPSVEFFSMFGLTECKRVCYLPPGEIDRRPGSVGIPIPDCEVRLLDPEGREVGPGEEGELVVRGANVMAGYWNQPELTARTFRPGPLPGERVLHSGDYFRRDEEGYLYFLGRRDDMIKTRGERVSPREIEEAIGRVPGVLEAAVIGVPDELLGQAIVAFVVGEAGCEVEKKAILRHCSRELEAVLVPREIVLLPALPRTPNGKVDREALRARLASSEAGKGVRGLR